MTKSFLSDESGLVEGYNFFEKNYIKYWGEAFFLFYGKSFVVRSGCSSNK